MTDLSVTPPVRRTALGLGRGEVVLLDLHVATDHVVAPQQDQRAEVHLGEQGPIEVRQPHHEDAEAEDVDQAEVHAQPTTVDQHDQRADG